MTETVQVCGVRSCAHVLEAGREGIVDIWFVREARAAALLRLKALASRHGLHYRELSRHELDRRSGFVRHQGVLIECHPPAARCLDIDDLSARAQREPLLLLVLDHLQDPHNLGACLRCAEAVAADAVMISKRQSAGLSAAASKAASGALAHVPVLVETNLAASLARLQKAGFWVSGMVDEAKKSIWEHSFAPPQAVVFGGEGRGLRRAVRELCDEQLRIPMLGKVESLNVSVACGITLYEARRQMGTALIGGAQPAPPGPPASQTSPSSPPRRNPDQ